MNDTGSPSIVRERGRGRRRKIASPFVALDPSSIMLTDRVVVVTGARQGIGRAAAALCARFGARVAICDRVPDELDAVPSVLSRVLDVRDAAARDAFVADVVAELGRVDVLVNNAGGTFFQPFLDVSENGEAALLAENFVHVTALVRRVVPHMPTGSSIVNVTSIEAHQAAPGFAVYGAMKAALAHLTRTLALELAPRGIRVNAVAPDAIPTTGDHDLQEAMRAAGAAYDPTVVPPLGRMGDPEDAAAAVVFLASELARFVTGTTVHVDGGNWAAGGWRRRDVS
jgi:NAD(P)-dependent dehydrogenase (short-subunit alcohol dehydrogenase family)